jgi:flavin-binding protein dodecin
MSNHVFKSLELTGTSGTNIEDAINNAVGRAAKTVHNMRWFEMVGVRGLIDKGAVSQWQVTLKIGFALEE